MLSQGYLIDSQLCIIALWLFYFAVLHRRVPLASARVYLLLLFPAGMLFPLLRIPLLPAPQAFTTTLPISDVPIVTEPALAAEQGFPILLLLYTTGAIAFGTFAIAGIIRTWLTVRNTRQGQVIFSAKVAGAYSVFGRIFVNDKFKGSPMLGQILAHEQSHLAHHHSRDLVWMSLWRSVLWFNPAVWHSAKLLREVHEFQADRAVIREGNPIGPYINLLIGTEAGIYPATANALCYSLTKKRLKMIAQATRRTSIGGYLRLAALPGLIGAMLCAFSLTAKAAEPLELQLQPALVAPADSLRQISVSVRPIPDTIDIQVEPVTATAVSSKKINYIDLDVKPDTARYSSIVTVRKQNPKTQPIYVIDGTICDADAMKKNQLTAADYHSITVLKGSAATSVYGEKGKDGAIVITTRKSVRPKSLTISDGEIRLGQNSTVGRTGNFDVESVKKVTVALSKKEKRKGITVSSKLLETYPDLFELSPDGSVQNRIPVSVTINEEK